jgi:glycosyltransferase involved in cell wall biosynthesis
VISNGVDTTYFRPDLRSEAIRASLGAGPGDFLVGYCGLHGLMQGLEVVVKAAKRLENDPRIRIVMIGDGPTKQMLVGLAKELKVTNLAFHDVRPKKEIPAILSSCDASLVPLATRLPGTMPSKFYEALAAGTPPLIAKGCEAEPLVNQHGVGATFEPLDDAELASAVRGLAAEPERHRRMREQCVALSKRFDRTVIAARTEKLLEAVAAGQALPDVPW